MNKNSLLVTKEIDLDLASGRQFKFFIIYLAIFFCLLFFHPYYILLFITIISLYIKLNKTFITLMFSIALAIFLSSRNYAVTWSDGGDDLVEWLIVFDGLKYDSFAEIISNIFSLSALKNNEPFFYLFTLLLGSITSSQEIYVFVNYFLLSLLLFYAACITSNRNYLLVFFLFLYGLGSFAEGPLLHLWRQTYSSLLAYIAIMGFWDRNRAQYTLLLGSMLTHLAGAFILFFRICFEFLYQKKMFGNFLNILIFSFFILFFFSNLESVVVELAGSNLIESYTGRDLGIGRAYITLSVLVMMFLMLRKFIISQKETFVLALLLSSGWMTVFFPYFGALAVRYGQFLSLFSAFILFGIFRKLPRYLILLLIPIMFTIKFVRQSNNEMVQAMFINYSSPWQGIFIFF